MLVLIVCSLIALMATVGFTVSYSKDNYEDVGLFFWVMLAVSVVVAGFTILGLSVTYGNVADREVVKHEVVKVESIEDTYRVTLKDGTKKVLEDKGDSRFKITIGDENILTEKKEVSSQVLFDLHGASYELEVASSLKRGQ